MRDHHHGGPDEELPIRDQTVVADAELSVISDQSVCWSALLSRRGSGSSAVIIRNLPVSV